MIPRSGLLLAHATGSREKEFSPLFQQYFAVDFFLILLAACCVPPFLFCASALLDLGAALDILKHAALVPSYVLIVSSPSPPRCSLLLFLLSRSHKLRATSLETGPLLHRQHWEADLPVEMAAAFTCCCWCGKMAPRVWKRVLLETLLLLGN